MIKVLARSIREYKKASILTPLLVTVEVILECALPFVIANLVNQMQAGCSMDVIVRYGAALIAMSVVSLIFGGAAGATCATASAGFARNLRKDMFYKIQDYSFENIDKFSVSSRKKGAPGGCRTFLEKFRRNYTKTVGIWYNYKYSIRRQSQIGGPAGPQRGDAGARP